MTCFNKVHFNINASRIGKSMIYNKCIFCNKIYATNAEGLGTHAIQVIIMHVVDSSSILSRK